MPRRAGAAEAKWPESVSGASVTVRRAGRCARGAGPRARCGGRTPRSCARAARAATGSPSESRPAKPRSWSRVNCPAKVISSRHAARASATTAGSATALVKSASGRPRSGTAWVRQARRTGGGTSRVPPRPCAGPARAGTSWRVPRHGGPADRHLARRTSAAASAAGSAGTRSASSARRRAAGRLRAGRNRDRRTGPPGAVACSRRPRLLLESLRPSGRRDAKCRALTVSEHSPTVGYGPNRYALPFSRRGSATAHISPGSVRRPCRQLPASLAGIVSPVEGGGSLPARRVSTTGGRGEVST